MTPPPPPPTPPPTHILQIKHLNVLLVHGRILVSQRLLFPTNKDTCVFLRQHCRQKKIIIKTHHPTHVDATSVNECPSFFTDHRPHTISALPTITELNFKLVLPRPQQAFRRGQNTAECLIRWGFVRDTKCPRPDVTWYNSNETWYKQFKRAFGQMRSK